MSTLTQEQRSELLAACQSMLNDLTTEEKLWAHSSLAATKAHVRDKRRRILTELMSLLGNREYNISYDRK